MEQTVTSTTTKGVVISLILIVLALAMYFANQLDGPLKWLGWVIFIGGIIWSVYSYGKQINYNATFGNYFSHGFKVSALVTAIMIIYIIIFMTLFPEFKDKAIDEARKKMQEKNNLSEDQINQGIEMTRKFFMVFVVGGTLLGYLISGALSALVGAAITKKQPGQITNDINQMGQ